MPLFNASKRPRTSVRNDGGTVEKTMMQELGSRTGCFSFILQTSLRERTIRNLAGAEQHVFDLGGVDDHKGKDSRTRGRSSWCVTANGAQRHSLLQGWCVDIIRLERVALGEQTLCVNSWDGERDSPMPSPNPWRPGQSSQLEPTFR